MRRIESLDWHRGLLAFSIMIYHLTGWHYYYPDSDDLLGRLGVYGVSMFFILSGLSMALVYGNYIRDGRTSVAFFIRRIFRIWPLLWVAVVVVTAGDVLLRHNDVAWTVVFLNVTTLFGFVSPGSYINTGAWSIGNEMVYYALTPALLWTYNRRLLYGNLLLAMTVAVAAYFAFHAISAAASLASQWSTYINPFNNLFLYCAGIAIYYNSRANSHGNVLASIALLIAIAIFCFYPANGDLVNIVVGPNRVVFCIASLLMVLAFYNLTAELPPWLSRVLGTLGLMTYGVYLLHPIAHSILTVLFGILDIDLSPFFLAALTVISTIGASLISYRLLEAPLIRLGKRTTTPQSVTPANNSSAPAEFPRT